MAKLFLKFLILFFLSFTGCDAVFADDPSRLIIYPPTQLLGFKGLDTRSTAPTLADGRATDILNVKLSSALDLRKRYGYSVINSRLDDLDTDSPAVTGIFDSVYSTGNSWTYVFLGSKLKYDNSGTWATVPGSGTITSGQDNQWKCIMALDNAICTNDTNVPIQISSTPTRTPITTTGFSSSLDKAKDVIWFRNYLIWLNTKESGTERPTRFRWSNVGTINTYTDADYVDISTFGGDEIIGSAELYGDIYIFLTKSIWKASLVGGNDVFNFYKVVDGIGAIARDSIQSIQFSDSRVAISFLDDRKKMFLFDGNVVSDIGAVIQSTLDGLNEARLQYAVSTFDGKDYYLSISSSGESTNDIILDFDTEIFEWTKHDQVDANALAQVKETTSKIKTYFGNYKAFVYWLDNPDNENDVDGATGIVDSVGTLSTNTITGGQVILDATLTTGIYTGAILRITSGTGSGSEGVILSGMQTGVIMATAFSTTPDSTSVYSIGAIDAQYTGKWYDLGEPTRQKAFRSMIFWAEEASTDEVTISYAEDFGSTVNSEIKDLAPSSVSLWDVALWDVGTWGSSGDKMYTVKLSGRGNYIQPKFANNDIDKSFHIFGYNVIADALDTKQ